MPAYTWLATAKLGAADITARMRTLRTLGEPYSDGDIAGAQEALAGKSELDAVVAYLQGLGVANVKQPAAKEATK